jgi:hypothetical protein
MRYFRIIFLHLKGFIHLKKPPFIQLVLILLILVVLSLSCRTSTTCDEINTGVLPENTPLDEFVIGNWLSVSARSITYDYQLPYIYQAEITNTHQITWVLYSPEGQVISSETWRYYFTDEETLYWDNVNIENGVMWHLYREEDYLRIISVGGGTSSEIKFKRGTYDCNYQTPTSPDKYGMNEDPSGLIWVGVMRMMGE